jgi:hypothetical protein
VRQRLWGGRRSRHQRAQPRDHRRVLLRVLRGDAAPVAAEQLLRRLEEAPRRRARRRSLREQQPEVVRPLLWRHRCPPNAAGQGR